MKFYQLPKDLIMTFCSLLPDIMYIKDYRLIKINVSYFIDLFCVFTLGYDVHGLIT